MEKVKVWLGIALRSVVIVLVVGVASVFAYKYFSADKAGENINARHDATSTQDTNATATNSSDDAVLAAWNAAVKTTPPIAGSNGWKPIEARATGEKGCTPGETRVNPKTGMLQGCR